MTTPTIILIRPFDQSISFAADFISRTGKDVPIRPSPLLRIEPIVETINIGEVSALLFTSTNAVRIYQSLCPPRRIRAFCVGAATSKAARDAGLIATNAEGDVSDLLELATARHMEGDPPYLYLRGEQVTGDLAGNLCERGTPCDELAVYRQRPAPMSPEVLAMIQSEPVVIPVFSANSAKALMAEIKDITPHNLTITAISAAAAKPLTEMVNTAITCAPSPSRKGMIAALTATV